MPNIFLQRVYQTKSMEDVENIECFSGMLQELYNIYHALIDNEEKEVSFKITNNGQSSSILELGIHANLYPHVVVSETRVQKTTRLDTFFETNNIDPSQYNFWNLDIQGTELNALKKTNIYVCIYKLSAID